MKKSSFLFLLALAPLFLSAHNGIHSVADFEQLYKSKVPPFDKISDTTFTRLKNGIFINEKGDFRGFLFIGGLRNELTYKEYLKFEELVAGIKAKYNKSEEEEG